MASIKRLNQHIDKLYELSLNHYKKLARSPSLNEHPREKLAAVVINPHLAELTKREELSESEVNLLMLEVTKKLMKS